MVGDGPGQGQARSRAAARRGARDPAASDRRGLVAEAALPELAAVPWRAPVDARWLRRWGRLWTLQTVAFVVPFTAGRHRPDRARAARRAGCAGELRARLGDPGAARLPRVEHDPSARGARATSRPSRSRRASSATCSATRRASSSARPGWRWSAAGSACGCSARPGAVLVANGGKRVHCFCVGTAERDLPPSDRIAHLLLALRTDEIGFATVANHAFSGAPWRLRRRIRKEQRPALDAARRRRLANAWPGTSSSPAAGSAASTRPAGSSASFRGTAPASPS